MRKRGRKGWKKRKRAKETLSQEKVIRQKKRKY